MIHRKSKISCEQRDAMIVVLQSSLKNLLLSETQKREDGEIDWELGYILLKSKIRLCFDFLTEILSLDLTVEKK